MDLVQVASLVVNTITLAVASALAFNAGRAMEKIATLDRDLTRLQQEMQNWRANVGTRAEDRE